MQFTHLPITNIAGKFHGEIALIYANDLHVILHLILFKGVMCG